MKKTSPKPSILFIAKTLPLFDRASGDYRLFQILRLLAPYFEIDFIANHIPAMNKENSIFGNLLRGQIIDENHYEILEDKYLKELKKIGVNVLTTVKDDQKHEYFVRPGRFYDIRSHLISKRYDIIWVEFYYIAHQYLDDIRTYQYSARLIVDSVDIHYRRKEMEFEYYKKIQYLLNDKQEKVKLDKKWFLGIEEQKYVAGLEKKKELKVYKSADYVVTVSEDDDKFLKEQNPNIKTILIPNIHSFPVVEKVPERKERRGLVFVGNFDHNPNISSAMTIKHEVAPRVNKELGEIPIYIVGNNPNEEVKNIGKFGACANQIFVTGYVPETREYLDKARISLAPINFGAGMNGKIGEALAAGIPVVTTALGAAGMGLTHEENCLIGGPDADHFAAQIFRLYHNDKLWNKLSQNGQEFIKKKLDFTFLEKEVSGSLLKIASEAKHWNISIKEERKALDDKLLFSIDKAPFPSLASVKRKFEKEADVSVVLVTHNQWKYTELCLRSIIAQVNADPVFKFNIIVVDNASSDETVKQLKKIKWIKLIENKKNLGFSKACNQAILAAGNADIILLNNDTITPKGWISRLVRGAKAVPGVGLIGTASNTEAGQILDEARYGSVAEFLDFAESAAKKYDGQWMDLDKVSGLCLYIPRETIKKVGLLEESFGIGYFEDDDYCLRTREHGLRTVFLKGVYLHHFGSVSFLKNGMIRRKHIDSAMHKFILKWGRTGLEHIRKCEHTMIQQSGISNILELSKRGADS